MGVTTRCECFSFSFGINDICGSINKNPVFAATQIQNTFGFNHGGVNLDAFDRRQWQKDAIFEWFTRLIVISK